jgi:drug/metabolite transporter (DMT)-like permease
MMLPVPMAEPGLRSGALNAAAMIAAVVLASSTGELSIAAAMKSVGNLDTIRSRTGIMGAARVVLQSPFFLAGVFFLALAFFALLFALNHLELSLVAPASASLTLVTNAIGGKAFLKENVDRRRWAAAILVGVGVYLLAH